MSLTAEEIERIRSVLTGNRIQAYKAGEQGVADVMTRIIDFQFNTLCDMALASLTEREEGYRAGIEAAAKVCQVVLDENKDGRKHISKQIADWCKLTAEICQARIEALVPPAQKKEGV